MPTVIGHTVAGIAFSTVVSTRRNWLRIGLLSVFCAVAPDLDTIGFRLGISYQHWLGHRGFFHGILFAAITALVATLFMCGAEKSAKRRLLHFLIFFLSGSTHGFLDAVTNGGLGVAFFSPFSEKRYFLPWQPIEVSPLSLNRFLTPIGMKVITSELHWVILPALCFIAVMRIGRIRLSRNTGKR